MVPLTEVNARPLVHILAAARRRSTMTTGRSDPSPSTTTSTLDGKLIAESVTHHAELDAAFA